MAEEFQAGICGSSWWNTSRHALVASPCSVGFNEHIGSFGCPNDMVDIKASRSSCGEINNSVSDHDDDHQHTDSGSVLIDSTLQMIGFDHSSSSSSTPSDLNQALLLSRSGGGRAESNFHNSMLQEGVGADEDSSSLIDGFKPMSQDFSLDQLGSSSSSGFPITSSSSAANSYGFPSTLFQSLFDSEVSQAQPQQSLFNNNHFSNDLLLPPSPTSSCWPPRYSPSSCLRPSGVSLPKQLQPGGGGGGGGLHFSNNINTPFWNTPAATALNHGNSIRSSNGLFSSSQQSQYTAPASSALVHEHKPNSHNFTTKGNTNEDVQDSSSVVKKSGSSMSSCEPVFKRARIETPSPLPTFKVRKEKLGDRITALQQLVSPFGKTDTASVLHEAIEYIKFLHEQVSVLSTPYMKNGAPMQHQQGSDHKTKEAEGAKHDLKSRGLCLVPISSTFPVANETTDFWTPTFGATFR
ncbi:transcription factor bHLH112-like isoform X1 [Prunus avium]|uniref:Transcription factor bHLH112-like isoform X1 n=1 Tax=Prunus avium TaxID=42229 RepID=A0A6P5S3V6_PRUAV|nr:transcription factor bHLH112-like isoform X1 [Prunus avium]